MSSRGVEVSGRAPESGGRGVLSLLEALGLTELSNFLEDDWGDNSLTNRTNPSDGVFAHPNANEAGDTLIGRYRPEWNTISGSPSAINQQLEIPAGDTTQQVILTTSKQAVGEWNWDAKANSSIGTGGFNLSVLVQGTSLDTDSRPANCYFQFQNSNGSHELYANSGGSPTSIISSSRSVPTSLADYKLTKDSYGNFEIFYNGTSDGTSSDTTYTSSNYTSFGTDSDSTIVVDNLVVK